MSQDEGVYSYLFDSIPEEWNLHSFPNAVDFQEGPGILAKDFRDAGVPLLRLSCLQENTSTLDGCDYLDPGMVESKWSHFRLLSGDILLSSSGTLGRSSILAKEHEGSICYTGIIRMRPRDKGVTAGFIRYFMMSRLFRHQIAAMSAGSVLQHFGPTHLKQMSIPVPTIAEQEFITEILSSLDEKIDLNRKQNRTLEAIAQALFKRWFVEFEFPDENGRPYKSSGGAMQPSELGEIPVGWEVKPLSDVTTYLSRGITPVYVEQGGVTVLNQKCVRDGWINTEPARRHDAEARNLAGRELQAGDVLVNSTGMGTLGRVALVVMLNGTVVVDSHITVVRADPSVVSPEYLGVFLRLKEREIEHMAEGSTGQTELSRTKLGELPMVVPDDRVLRLFSEVVADLNSKRTLNWNESLSLALARDTLLSKLMSGELRVA